MFGTSEWPPDPGGAGSFKQPPDEAVTKEVTVGPWIEPLADKKGCVTSSTNSNQFNFFESNEASKPAPVASKYSDPDAAFVGTRSFPIQPPSGPPSGLQTRAKLELSSAPQTQARSRHSSGLQTQAGLGHSNGLRMRR